MKNDVLLKDRWYDKKCMLLVVCCSLVSGRMQQGEDLNDFRDMGKW